MFRHRTNANHLWQSRECRNFAKKLSSIDEQFAPHIRLFVSCPTIPQKNYASASFHSGESGLTLCYSLIQSHKQFGRSDTAKYNQHVNVSNITGTSRMKDDHSVFLIHDRAVIDRRDLAPNFGRPPATFYVNWGKRLFDIAFAAGALILLSPAIALFWLIISLDGGNGFYGQERIGKGRRVFTCWKLRSMVVNSDLVLAKLCASNDILAAEWDLNQKLAIDPRITRIGKFIRKTRIDELPQLWNVLIGDMSVVGPRPFMRQQMSIYVQAGGTAYFHLRPGVTGPWQVAAKQGDDMAFVGRIAFDEIYAGKVSFLGDIGIILKTIKTVFRMNGQ